MINNALFMGRCDGPLGDTVYILSESGHEVPRVHCLTCNILVYGYNHVKYISDAELIRQVREILPQLIAYELQGIKLGGF